MSNTDELQEFMNISERENKLFDIWMKKKGRKPFIKDGLPSPEEYLKSKVKILFILKDANFGISDEDNKSGNFDSSPHDLRAELRKDPHVWWRKVRNWCAPLLDSNLTWEDVKNKDIGESLAPFGFIQLKKNAGSGSVKYDTLLKVAKEDREEIKNQIAIYNPDFIVCCGVGEILYEDVYSGLEQRTLTPEGVGYWKVNIGSDDTNSTYIIDYCHPSARFGTRIEGVVAFGLVKTINYLKTLCDNEGETSTL